MELAITRTLTPSGYWKEGAVAACLGKRIEVTAGASSSMQASRYSPTAQGIGSSCQELELLELLELDDDELDEDDELEEEEEDELEDEEPAIAVSMPEASFDTLLCGVFVPPSCPNA